MPGSAFDTNIFAYAAGIGESLADRAKVALAEDLLTGAIDQGDFVVPAQVCLEFYHVLVRKRGLDAAEAAAVVGEYTQGALIAPTDHVSLQSAFELARRHHLQIYDAVVLAAAVRGGCDILYSEDMQDGFEWEGVRIVNPFA